MPFWLYQSLCRLALPLIALALRLRGDPPARIDERLGQGPARAKGLWFHAASVGEVKALAPLLNHFGDQIGLLTVQSRQGLETAERLFGNRFPVEAAPLDHPRIMGRFLSRFEATGLVLYENELWPGWLRALGARGMGVLLLNAAFSARTQGFWRRSPGLLQGLSRVTSSTPGLELPVPVEPALPLKLAGEALPVDPAVLAPWREWLGADALLIFASVHPEEAEAILVNMVEHAGSKVIIAPRHPDKIKAFKRLIGEETERLRYWDGFGTLGALYALGGTVILGGSFSRKTGAHSPMEALRAGRPVVVGPYPGKQASLLALLDREGLITPWPAKPDVSKVDVSAVDGLAQQALAQAVEAVKALAQSKDP